MIEDRMCHLMIDVETLSTRSNAVILSIGVVQFDLRGSTIDRFYQAIDIHSCLNSGLCVDASTIEFWFSQPEEVIYKTLFTLPKYKLKESLRQLEESFTILMPQEASASTLYLWSHGSSFDLVILENAYYAVGSKPWWNHRNVRDTRTLFDLADYKYKSSGNHNALEDARNQAKAVQEAYQKLKGGK